MLLKTVEVDRFRGLYSGSVEIDMLDRVYKAQDGDVRGSEFFCKPFLMSPLLKQNKWRLGIATERALGKSLVSLPSGTDTTYRVYAAVERAVVSMWLLGFAHNDLHRGNVVYDVDKYGEVQSVKIIDTESMVDLRGSGNGSVVQDFKTALMQKGVAEASEVFLQVYRTPALNLLAEASKFCTQFGDSDNVLGAPDQDFLPSLCSEMFKGRIDEVKMEEARKAVWSPKN